MSKEWKVGEVVMLVSGGARMTVSRIGKNTDGRPSVFCVWQEAKGKGFVQTEREYHPDVLVSGARRAISLSF